ncbi:zinc finger HIT domain-containing protein 3 [Scaptodrosophila lebanonensis]|uniref:Zinc finger HIT domain-containing protein 3 n=1 Tax=Drosophila lebanonensis TaxID=7225 RepID=A0A6J2U8Y0_DROLE|nr:zinc finger HIT domain-containing protein 3 [Scaptodrosophila lebanonensis]
MAATCITCEQITRKYKCSKCEAPYCSLACYKSHKGTEECAQLLAAHDDATKFQKLTKTSVDEEEPTLHAPFPTEDTVSPAMLQQLASSEPLRQLLYNPHLRNLLQQIDVALNAQNAMAAAMQEPLFVEFANACLQVVEPMSEAELAELERCS